MAPEAHKKFHPILILLFALHTNEYVLQSSNDMTGPKQSCKDYKRKNDEEGLQDVADDTKD